MSKPLKPFQLISLCLAGFVLCACASDANKPASQLHPYLEETKAIELQAIDALQLGNYRQALRLYNKAYSAYSAVDETPAMARQLVNQAQVALIVEDLVAAKVAIDGLASHLSLYQLTLHQDRLNLLRANLAIAEQAWSEGLDHLTNISSSPSKSVKDSAMVSRAIAEWNLGELSDPDKAAYEQMSSALSKARLGRLIAEVESSRGNFQEAMDYLAQARALYRKAAFAPGVAEVLVLSANIAEQRENRPRAIELRKRAKEIFQRLGNTQAITRYGL